MLLIAAFSPLIIGISIIVILFPRDSLNKNQLLTEIFLGTGLGLGITSVLTFLWLAVVGQPAFTYYIAEIGIAVGLAVLAGYRIISSTHADGDPVWAPKPDDINLKWLKHIFIILLFLSVASFILKTFGGSPHGKWDAWAFWNFRARWLFRGEDQWAYAFSEYVKHSHPDYPLLWPASVFRIWRLMGKDSVAIPILMAGFFTFGSVLLIWSSVAMLRGRNQAYLAAILMLLTTKFIKEGTHQYSDVPLAFYILSTIILFSLKRHYPAAGLRIMCLAGMTTSCAYWTKNEGVAFGVLIIMVHIIGDLFINDWRRSLKEFIGFVIGALPILGTLIFFKLNFAPPNDIVNLHSLSNFWHNLFDYDRYYMVLKAFAEEIFLFNDGVAILLTVYVWISGIKKGRLRDGHFIAQVALLVSLLVCYFFTYVIFSHRDLSYFTWHLNTSVDRLLIHTWPSWVFLLFYCVNGPQKPFVMDNRI